MAGMESAHCGHHGDAAAICPKRRDAGSERRNVTEDLHADEGSDKAGDKGP
jgi:hypothetical protein